MIPAPGHDLTVYYDSACPLCRREVAFYRRLDRRRRVHWVDLHGPAREPMACGLTREAALQRLHAVEAGGRTFSGARAFAAIWRRLPGLRLAGFALGVPPLVWLAEPAYRGFLRVRPLLARALPASGRGAGP